MAGSLADGIVISTFHSLGVRILRRDIRALGFKPNFSIYSTSDQAGVLRQAMRERDIDPKKIDPDRILWKISGAEEPPDRPEGVHPGQATIRSRLPPPRSTPAIRNCSRASTPSTSTTSSCSRSRLLQSNPAILAHWQERFRYIMVDEYQDTNASQYLMISLLGQKARQHLRRRRRRPVHLRLARGRGAEHPQLRTGLPRLRDHQAGAELPLHQLNPGCRQQCHQKQPGAHRQGALDRQRQGARDRPDCGRQ